MGRKFLPRAVQRRGLEPRRGERLLRAADTSRRFSGVRRGSDGFMAVLGGALFQAEPLAGDAPLPPLAHPALLDGVHVPQQLGQCVE